MGDTIFSILYGLLVMAFTGGILALCSGVKAICRKILKGREKND